MLVVEVFKTMFVVVVFRSKVRDAHTRSLQFTAHTKLTEPANTISSGGQAQMTELLDESGILEDS